MGGDEKLGHLKITSQAILVEITSEPFVIYTSRGYAPAVTVKTSRDGKSFNLFISASSLGRALEAQRQANNGALLGLEIWVKRESDEQMAGYVVEAAS